MYLRAENEDANAIARREEFDRRIECLRVSLGDAISADSARNCIDLASILCWRGHYRPTYELLQPLTNGEFPDAIAFEARQMIADNHFRHDQYDLANRSYHENLECAKRLGEGYWIARARDGMAWVLIDVGHYTTGEFEEAGRIFAENLPLHRKLGMWVSEAMGIYGLSRATAGKGDYDQAIKLAHCSIELLQEREGHHLVQLPLLQLANVYRDQGSFDRAKPYYESAIDAADRSQDPYIQALTGFHYGCLLKYTGEIEAARRLWRSTLPTIGKLEFPRLGSETCGRLAHVAAEIGDFGEAYRLQIESQEYGNRVGVISPILQNQQMNLRAAMHQTGQLESELTHLMAGVEASEDGIFVLSPPTSETDPGDFLVRFANSAAAQMLGKAPININHVLIATAWKSATCRRLIEPSAQVYADGGRRTLDPVELEFSEGKPRWYAVKIARISDGIAWTVSDVTERETMRQEITAQRDRLEEANARLTALDREKTEMLGIAAHDLRSPIGNIRSLCELIETDDPDTAYLKETIETTANSLLALISDLLDVDRIERGELELDIRPVGIAPVLAKLVGQFSAEASQKGISIQASGLDEAGEILADESALRRVVQNLLSNAVKFSPAGATVHLRATKLDQRRRIEIQDQGPGISHGDRGKLFGKFARLSARPTAGESSTGLGLSIVKNLVEAMNGEVGCDSEPGQGATFWLELPG